MAYFSAMGGSGGAGATITVSYSSQFYNKTMTCSKGSKTYTKITTSSGSTVFDVDETGTWTITCDGISRTVDVILEYSTQMAITKTITVYSAASDTVSFTDVTGAKTVTTDTSGQNSVSITFIPPSTSITFTSSVAKSPNNLSQVYSKTVTISTSTSEVYIMPNNALYWWGYMSDNCEECSPTNGWTNIGTYVAPVKNTHSISLSPCSGIGNKTAISGLTKAYAIASGTGNTAQFATQSAKAFNIPITNYTIMSSLAKYELSNPNNDTYMSANVQYSGNNTITLNALWYE